MDPNTVIASVPIKREPGEADEQQASQEATEPANMANEENEPNQLKLNLNHSTRKQLFTVLNDLSAILQYNQPIPADAKQRTSKKIDDLILVLVNLSPSGPSRSSADSNMFEERIADQLTADLSRAERSRIVSHLIDLKDAILSGDLFTVETKRCLIDENKQMVVRLLDLPVRIQSDGDLPSDEDTDESNDEPVSKRQRVEAPWSELLGLNEELNVTASQGERMASPVVRLNEPTSDPMREIKNPDAARWEVSFKFELAEVSKFFELFEDDANERLSDTFWCRGLPWSLRLKGYHRENGTKVLGFYLACRHDEPSKWSCKVEFNLILFSQLPGSKNKIRRLKYTFKVPTSFGNSRFISYHELTNEKNGFIKDDKIVLGVELKARPLVRK